MLQIVKLFAAWALALPISVAVALLFVGQRGPLFGGLREGLLGLGLTVGIPTLIFALIAVWPIAALLHGISKPWLYIAGATGLFGVAMLALTAAVMPDGWQGASKALIGFATLLGLVWGVISVLTMRSASVA